MIIKDNTNESTFDLKFFLDAILFARLKIILIMLFFFVSFLGYYFLFPKSYLIQSTIQIAPNTFSSTEGIEAVLGQSDSTILDEYIEIYKSKTNILEVISNNKFDITIDNDFYFNKDLPFKINSFNDLRKYDNNSITNFIFELNQNSYSILYDNDKYSSLEFDKDNFIDNFVINISKKKNYNDYINATFDVSKLNRLDLYKSFNKNIQVKKIYADRMSFLQANASLFEVSMIVRDRGFGILFLESLNKVFSDNNLNDKKKLARASLDFIEEQIEIVYEDLNQSQRKLNLAKEKNISIDVDFESIQLIEKYNAIIEKINEINLKLVSYKSIYQESNPIYASLLAEKDLILSQLKSIEEEIKTVPEIQKNLLDFSREVSAQQDMYQLLLEAKLEYSIAEAASLGNIKIIDNPYVVAKASPKGLESLVPFMFICFLFVIALVLVQKIYFGKILSVEDLFNLRKKIVGVLPKLSELKFNDEYDFHNKETINDFITNLLHLMAENNGKKLSILSSIPNSGKTFSTMIIGDFLSKRGKKVLLFDGDYKKGNLNEYFSKPALQKKSEYLDEDIDIEKFIVSENLYFIPRVKGENDNALRLFESFEFASFVSRMEEKFDYIIFDTPPLFPVSDAIALCNYTDVNIVSVRQNYTSLREIYNLDLKLQPLNIEQHAYVLGAYARRTGYLYAGYGADKYYRYYKDYYTEEDN